MALERRAVCAEEAGISRPALYPVFSSKEEIFGAVLSRVLAAELEEIRAGVAKAKTPAEKLMAALEIWCVRNYEVTRGSPGAADLFESSFAFASEVAKTSTTAFEAVLADVLAPLVRSQSASSAKAPELARLISQAIVGFKATTGSAKQLRASVQRLVDVVLASLGHGR